MIVMIARNHHIYTMFPQMPLFSLVMRVMITMMMAMMTVTFSTFTSLPLSWQWWWWKLIENMLYTMMISSWLHFQPLFPKYHPFSVSFSFVMMITKHYIFHFLDKQLHPQLNQVVPRQPYVGQRQQLPERTEGVATHFHHKVTFPKLMRMATIIIIITILILNKSLSGKWRGRISGNTLAGASKLYRTAWYILYRHHEYTATSNLYFTIWSFALFRICNAF